MIWMIREIRFAAFILLAFLLLHGGAAPLYAGTASCLAGKCHRDIAVKRYIHGPIGSGSCDVCHQVSSWPEAKHPSLLTRADAARCLYCHEEAKYLTQQKYVHTPVAKGECTSCHDPHQADNSFMLATEQQGSSVKIADVCFSCHDKSRAFWSTGFHGAVSLLDCIVCHDPHGSPYQFELTTYVKTVYLRDYLAIGREDLLNKDYPAALVNLMLVLTVDPREVSALTMAAQAYLALGDSASAVPLVNKLLEINPLDSEAYHLKSRIAASGGNDYQAISLLNQSLNLKPDVPEVLVELGTLQLKSKMTTDALSTMLKAVEKAPSLPDAHRVLADIYLALGRPKEAEKEKALAKQLSALSIP